ncbi:MAG: hypothetical protein IIB59_01795 [Planctomycetes bacterium]|nr:hypothetical protein [Planctomycetota bacterium]
MTSTPNQIDPDHLDAITQMMQLGLNEDLQPLGERLVAEELSDNDARFLRECYQALYVDHDWKHRTDWHNEYAKLAGFVRDVLGGQQDSLFKDEKVAQLEALRRITSGHGLAQVLIDCAVQMAVEGRSGPDAPVEAATNALAVWASRGARQVEEHYCRESTVPRAHNVRARIEEGINGASLDGLARQLSSPDPGTASRPPQKQQGLDDGVRL